MKEQKEQAQLERERDEAKKANDKYAEQMAEIELKRNKEEQQSNWRIFSMMTIGLIIFRIVKHETRATASNIKPRPPSPVLGRGRG